MRLPLPGSFDELRGQLAGGVYYLFCHRFGRARTLSLLRVSSPAKKFVGFLRSCSDFVARVHKRLHVALFGSLNLLLCLCVPTYPRPSTARMGVSADTEFDSPS
jgi:hypothetical protein